MESKIPLPTDNIYKFYALFGLLLLVTCIVTFAYVHQTTNALLFGAYETLTELELKEAPQPIDLKKTELIKKRIEIAIDDKRFNHIVLAFLMILAGLLAAHGFNQWRKKIQPQQDELLDLQIQKAKLELAKLQKEAQDNPVTLTPA